MLHPIDIRQDERVMDMLRKMYKEWGINPPEEVYHECRSGKATLFLCDDIGFVILKSRHDDSTLEDDLFIWIGCSWVDYPGMVDRYLPEIEKLGKELGAKTVSFQSPRKGFGRILSDRWKEKFTEYSVRIENE